MGPILIFDKSTLQGLNPDQAMWMDHFFLCNITPLFYIETLADLEKQTRKGRSPEEVVGNLSYKSPDYASSLNVHHETLLHAELLGLSSVEIGWGRPIVSGGTTYQLGDQTGVVFQPSPEQEAFERWQKKEFLELERSLAKKWRNGLKDVNLEENYQFFQSFFPMGKPNTLKAVMDSVRFYMDVDNQEGVLRFGLNILGVNKDVQQKVIEQWKNQGRKMISEYAPFFYHVVSVELFFNLGMAADLIGRERPSHKVDIAYLYYLPFCMVFSSNDNLHSRIAPFFLRKNQTFISGADLKKALSQVDAHYNAFPEEVKKIGVSSFAPRPPHDSNFVISQLWDKHMSPHWKEGGSKPPSLDKEGGSEIIDKINKFKNEGIELPQDAVIDPDSIDHMVIERRVSPRKGKWQRFPDAVLNRRKRDDGSWEDVAV